MSNFFWLREIELTVSDKYWHSTHDNPIKIEFDITSKAKTDNNDGADIDLSTISIYNISMDNRTSINKGDNIILNAGYKDNVGNLFVGKVEGISIERSGMDIITHITASDGGAEWKQAYISKTYQAGSKASYIMRDVANTMGYEVAVIEPTNDIEYKLGRSINGLCGTILKELVRDTNSKMYIDKNRLYIMNKDKGIENGFLLNTNHGLLTTPERQEKEEDGKKIITYVVSSKLNHELTVNSLIKVESMTINGKFRIEEVKHTDDFVSELVVVEVN